MAGNLDTLKRAVRERRAILFAGAGVSRAVGLPTWDELIGHMCEDLGIEPTTAGPGRGAGYQVLAEYFRIRHGSLEPIRCWMEDRWRIDDERVRRSAIHRMIVELDFPIIYTTNYDRNLEAAFEMHGRPYARVASVRDIATSLGAERQIVKYHGDLGDSASLVLTESDFFDRLSFEGPLDIKLRADALARTVLFIGYSMSDPNIRLLLYRLWQLWQGSNGGRDRPASFVLLAGRDPVQEAVLGRWGLTVLGSDETEPQAALTSFLEHLLQR